MYFTTDILLADGDTLRAGHNFAATDARPQGFLGAGGYLIVQRDHLTRFRDSLFEVRFRGAADSIQKSGSVTLHITNSALLFP